MTDIEPRETPGVLDSAQRLLRELEAATSATEVRLIVDRAEALKDVAKRARMTDEQLRLFAGLSLRAQRRGGELLRATPRSRGGRGKLPSVAEVLDLPEHKAKHVAEDWLAVAEVPEDLFDTYLTRQGPVPTRAGLLRFRQPRGPRRRPGRPPLQPVPEPPAWEVDARAQGWQEAVQWLAEHAVAGATVAECLGALEEANPYRPD